ncbi:MAG: hypothetical protein RLZZ546_3340 [Bacteroidota bacterium]|jgi:hypothetical protein
MITNNFKELEREIVSNRERQLQKIQYNLNHSRSIFQTIGDLIELYIPRFFGALIKTSDTPGKENSKYPHQSN